MGFLNKAWAFIRKLPVAKYIKPLWKSGLSFLVQNEGDRAQVKLGDEFEAKGPDAAARVIDSWGNALVAGVIWLPLPHGIETWFIGLIRAKQTTLRFALAEAVRSGGRPVIDKAFDAAQKGILEKIAAR